jgi:hypothetical protein
MTILNLYPPKESLPTHVQWLMGDGRRLPFPDRAFDLVYSNSVIEHLGDWESQRHFAEEIARVGARYYVQTPNRDFPIEPHLFTPAIHFLPKRWQSRLLRNYTVWGRLTKPTQAQCDALLREIRLLRDGEMRVLFPGATIVRERVAGLTKSFFAVRS